MTDPYSPEEVIVLISQERAAVEIDIDKLRREAYEWRTLFYRHFMALPADMQKEGARLLEKAYLGET